MHIKTLRRASLNWFLAVLDLAVFFFKSVEICFSIRNNVRIAKNHLKTNKNHWSIYLSISTKRISINFSRKRRNLIIINVTRENSAKKVPFLNWHQLECFSFLFYFQFSNIAFGLASWRFHWEILWNTTFQPYHMPFKVILIVWNALKLNIYEQTLGQQVESNNFLFVALEKSNENYFLHIYSVLVYPVEKTSQRIHAFK